MMNATALNDLIKDISLLILDVDGVLTDGTLQYTESGELVKNFNAKDGFGIRMAMEWGITVAVISARTSPALERRIRDLRISHFYTGHDNKLSAFVDLQRRLPVPPQHIAFVGDDVLDIPVMRAVGLPIAVQDAHFMARETALLVTDACGGHGAVREVTDRLIAEKTDLRSAYEQFLKKHVGTTEMTTL